jgi:predicted RNase H-like nuclease (RuvC/YqgF family)
LPKGTYEVGNTFCLETLRYCKGGDKIEVIEEVPSYEELQNQAFILKSRESEIVKLKELLKECRDEIEYLRKHYKGSIDHLKNNTRLDKEISQVLGEE